MDFWRQVYNYKGGTMKNKEIIILVLGIAFLVIFTTTQFYGKGRYELIYGVSAKTITQKDEILNSRGFKSKTYLLDTVTGTIWEYAGLAKWKKIRA